MAVCEVIIAVQSNPRMKDLGEDMKKMLERKCSVCSCMCVFICMHELVCMHTPNYIILPLPSALLLLCNRGRKGLVRLDRFACSRGMCGMRRHKPQLLADT